MHQKTSRTLTFEVDNESKNRANHGFSIRSIVQHLPSNRSRDSKAGCKPKTSRITRADNSWYGGSWECTPSAPSTNIFKKRSTCPDAPSLRHAVTVQLMTERSMADRSERKPEYVKLCRWIVESKRFTILILVTTVYVLIADDCRLMLTSRPADATFDVLTAVCLVILILEIVLSSIGKEDYLLGFFFLMDVICTMTMALDFTAVSEALIVGDEENIDRFSRVKVATSHRIVRVLRHIRIIKLYKGILLSRRLAHAKSLRLRSDDDPISPGEDPSNDQEGSDILGESQVGRKLAELTVRRVVFVVLVLTIIRSMCDLGLEQQLPTSLSYGAEVVFGKFKTLAQDSTLRTAYEKALLQFVYHHNWFTRTSACEDASRTCPANYYSSIFWLGVAGDSELNVSMKSQLAKLTSGTVLAFNTATSFQRSMYYYGSMPPPVLTALSSSWSTSCNVGNTFRKGISLLENKVDDLLTTTVRCPEDLRAVERTKYAPRLITRSQFRAWHLAFYTDDRPFVKVDALFNLIATCFICLVLWVASVLHNIDASVLLLKPLEKMVLTVNMIRINPFMAKELAHDATKREQLLKVRTSRLQTQSRGVLQLRKLRRCLLCKPRPQTQVMETRILENTIVKLGLLLCLGFGEAGSNIVGRNLSHSDSAAVNAMVPGCQVQCIIGIARIRNFGIVTEVLGEEVMAFVNQVAEIVHGMVDEYHGGANRMTGDSFLLIWTLDGFDPEHAAAIADMSVVAFTKIYAEVHSSRALHRYRGHDVLQMRLGSARPIDLSFGMHYGMAVEGAVGTEYKIDACYVSPDVSVAESIERGTDTYAVNIMLTSALHRLCTDSLKEQCRLVDCIVVRGCPDPMHIYVMDVNSKFRTLEEVDPPADEGGCLSGLIVSFTSGQMKSSLTEERYSYRASDIKKSRKWFPGVLEEDLQHLFVQAMRAPYTVEFFQLFNMGYQNYSEGEWMAAKRILEKTQHMLGFEDGPSSCLLRFMAKTSFECPKDWKGYHALRFLEAAAPGVEASQRASFVCEDVAIACSEFLRAEAAARQDDWDVGSDTARSDVDAKSRVKRKGGQSKVAKRGVAKKNSNKAPTKLQAPVAESGPDKPATGGRTSTLSSAAGVAPMESKEHSVDIPETVTARRVTTKWKKSVAKNDLRAHGAEVSAPPDVDLPMVGLNATSEKRASLAGSSGKRMSLANGSGRKPSISEVGAKKRWTKTEQAVKAARASGIASKEDDRQRDPTSPATDACDAPVDGTTAVDLNKVMPREQETTSEKSPSKKSRRTWKKGQPSRSVLEPGQLSQGPSSNVKSAKVSPRLSSLPEGTNEGPPSTVTPVSTANTAATTT